MPSLTVELDDGPNQLEGMRITCTIAEAILIRLRATNLSLTIKAQGRLSGSENQINWCRSCVVTFTSNDYAPITVEVRSVPLSEAAGKLIERMQVELEKIKAEHVSAEVKSF